MLPTIIIGRFVFPTTGLVYIFGAWFCLSLVERAARRLKLHPEPVYGVAATAVFAGVIGARLTFVFQYWPAFQENLISIVWPLTSGYNAWGGLLFGLAGAFFYGRAKQLPPAPTFDALVPGLVLGFMVISLADFLGGPGYGTTTHVPWGMSLYGLRRHPVQIYEILAGVSALAVWWRLADRLLYPGQLALMSTAVYCAGRLFVDAYRENAWLIPGNGLHILQIITLITLLTALFLLAYFQDEGVRG